MSRLQFHSPALAAGFFPAQVAGLFASSKEVRSGVVVGSGSCVWMKGGAGWVGVAQGQ